MDCYCDNRVTELTMFLAPSPDNSLKFYFWDVQYAPPYDNASVAFQLGFRDDQAEQFRWVAHMAERMEAKMAPIHVKFLLGPPCAWPWQLEGLVVDLRPFWMF